MMEPLALGIAALVILFLLILIGMPVAIALISVSMTGLVVLDGWNQAAAHLQFAVWELGTNYLLIVLPLFILMGQLVQQTGLARDLYRAFQAWVGHYRGGLADATVLSASLFGATTGSSVAAVSALSSFSLPEMRRHNYRDALSAPAIAAAGVLAILLPPSVPLVFFGLWTETSIGALFLAGVVPGLLLAALFLLTIRLRCALSPDLGPATSPLPFTARLQALRYLIPTLALFIALIIGMYQGWFTPTEAGACGALAVFLVTLLMRRLNWQGLHNALRETARLTGVIFLIFVGGLMMSRFLVLTDLTPKFIGWITGQQPEPMLFLCALVVMYVVLGMILDTLGMIIITLPFVFPAAVALGVDPVWFGIFLAMMVEVSLITPPVGINVLLLQRTVPDLSMRDTFVGILPFVATSLLMIALLLVFPELATWLPDRMQGRG